MQSSQGHDAANAAAGVGARVASRRQRRPVVAALLVVLGAGLASVGAVSEAAAQAAPGQGQTTRGGQSGGMAAHVLELVRAGNDAFDAANYEEAYTMYTKAHELLPNAAIAYRMGQTAERLGRARDAVAHYEAFLALESGGETADRVRERLSALRATLPARVTVASQPAGAEVRTGSAGGATLGKTPLEVELPAGDVTFVVMFPGHASARKSVTLAAGEDHRVSFELTEITEVDELGQAARPARDADVPPARPAATEPRTSELSAVAPPPAAESGSNLGLWGWSTVGVGAAALATGGVFSVLQHSATEKVNSYNKRGAGASAGQLQGHKDDAMGYYNAARIAYIAGGAVTAVGATLVLIDMFGGRDAGATGPGAETVASERTERGGLELDGGVVPGGGWFGVRGAF